MGLNVWQKDGEGRWLAGSFSGMFVWDRTDGKVLDFFTGDEVHEVSGPPFGKRAVSGCIYGISSVLFIVEYEKAQIQCLCRKNFPHFLCLYGILLWKYIQGGFIPCLVKELWFISSLRDWLQCGVYIQDL